jgi:hypothetical protein
MLMAIKVIGADAIGDEFGNLFFPLKTDVVGPYPALYQFSRQVEYMKGENIAGPGRWRRRQRSSLCQHQMDADRKVRIPLFQLEKGGCFFFVKCLSVHCD